MPPYQPPRSRSPVGWIIALVGMGLFVVLILAVIFVSRQGKKVIDQIQRGSGSSRAEVLSGEAVLNETSADEVTQAGNQITFTKTFPIDDEDVAFAIKNVNGNVLVEAWDRPEAQVTVIKRGSESDRKSALVYFKQDESGLSLRTAYPRGSNKSDVLYQIKLPRELKSVNVNTVNGGIKLTDISAEITAQTVNGLVDLTNVAGLNKAQSVNGNIKAILRETSQASMEFKNVNGNVDVQIKGALDADLEANAVHGTITIDDQFGVPVQKQMVGQKASGQIGAGGTPLKLTTVNGNIKLSK